MYGNNVTGTIQPIEEISHIVRNFRNSKSQTPNLKQIQNSKNPNFQLSTHNYPLFHTDAVQCFQYLDCRPDKLGVDLLSLSSHKVYGPKGVGLLYIKTTKQENRKTIEPIITGGSQEFGLRASTPNTAGIVGFAKALELSDAARKQENKKAKKQREFFWGEIKKKIPNAVRNTPEGEKALPHVLNVTFPGTSNIVALFDAHGVAVSSGAACSTRAGTAPYVLSAMGVSAEDAKSSVRFSLGKETTKEELKEAVRRIKKALS